MYKYIKLDDLLDNNLFNEMDKINLEIIKLFKRLDIENKRDCNDLRNKNVEIRKKIQDLSEKTEVPIEPTEVRDFLDNIMSISDEVLFGIVPGGKLGNNV